MFLLWILWGEEVVSNNRLFIDLHFPLDWDLSLNDLIILKERYETCFVYSGYYNKTLHIG
jgi:hypothetical protein